MNAGGYAGVGLFPYDGQADTSDEYGSESVPMDAGQDEDEPEGGAGERADS